MVDLGLGEERDDRAPAWRWLRGFALFLLAWPLLSLFAADQFDFDDWEAILIAVLGPAGVGLVLLGVERVLTRLFARGRTLAQAPPSVLADLANLGLCVLVLVVVDVALITLVDDEDLWARGDPPVGVLALRIAGAAAAVALLFRGLHRLVHGPARVTDLGDGWDQAPQATRLLGYLTLIPTLLVTTVMIDYAMHRKPGFGPLAWVGLLALVWLGLRSAAARAPRYWARDPWRAWLRTRSLLLPWWGLGVVLALALGVLFLLLPTGWVDDEGMTTTGRVVTAIVAIPLGLIVLFGVGATLVGLPGFVTTWRVAASLARAPERLLGWAALPGVRKLRLRLADGRELELDFGPETEAILRNLATHQAARHLAG